MMPLPPAAGRRLVLTLLWVVLPCVLLILAGIAAADVVDRPFALFVRDVTVAADLPYYSGALSGVNVMIWTAGAAIALAAALPRWRRPEPLVRMTLVLGLLGLLLACDDQFQLHEAVAPRFGIPENVVLGTYALGALVAVVAFRRELVRRPEGVVLALAILLLGGSVVVDVLAAYVDLPETPRIALEDGLKLVGAGVWTSALVSLASSVTREERDLP